MAMNFDPNFLNLITQIMGGVSGKVNNAVLGAPMPTQGTPQSSALTGLAQNRAQAGQQMLGGVLSAPSSPAQAAPAPARKPQGALSPLQQVEMGNRGEVAGVLAQVPEEAPQQEQMNPTDQRLAMGTQASPMEAAMQPPQQDPGILSKVGDFLGPNFLGRLGNGLMVAGSQDPAKALTMLRQQEADEKEAEARRLAASKPKVMPLADGAFSLMVMPDGTQKVVKNEEVAGHLSDMYKAKSTDKFSQMVLQALVNNGLKTAGLADKATLDAAPELAQVGSNIQELRSIASELGEVGPDGKFIPKADNISGPLMGTLTGTPIIRGLPGVSKGTDLRNRAEKVVQEGLRAVLGGQFTQAEGDRFLSRTYNPDLDEETNYRNMIRAAEQLEHMKGNREAALAYFQKNRTLDGFVGQGAGAAPQAPQAAPKAGGMTVPGLSPRASQYFQ